MAAIDCPFVYLENAHRDRPDVVPALNRIDVEKFSIACEFLATRRNRASISRRWPTYISALQDNAQWWRWSAGKRDYLGISAGAMAAAIVSLGFKIEAQCDGDHLTSVGDPLPVDAYQNRRQRYGVIGQN
jgi:hypothetical protein